MDMMHIKIKEDNVFIPTTERRDTGRKNPDGSIQYEIVTHNRTYTKGEVAEVPADRGAELIRRGVAESSSGPPEAARGERGRVETGARR